MDMEERWQKTLAQTKVLRHYCPRLSGQEVSTLPYIFLGQSVINQGDTVVRRGNIMVDKPLILLPNNMPQLSGFDFEQELGKNSEDMRLFLMIRGIRLPSLKYHNETSTMDVVSEDIESLAEKQQKELIQKEDIYTGLMIGPVECWQLSLLVYVGMIISRSAPHDFKRFLKEKGLSFD